MNRIPENLKKKVTDVRGNELIIIPEEGEFGFEEYLHEKAVCYVSKRKFRTDIRKHSLLLSYPDHNREQAVFNLFFESAEVRSGEEELRGIFAIDVTDYMDHVESQHFMRLMSYINSCKETLFVLFVFEKDKEKAKEFYKQVKKYGMFEYEEIPYPDAEALADYYVERLEEYFSTEIDPWCGEYACKQFEGKKWEYDFIDRLVNELILNECPLETEAIIKNLVEAMEYYAQDDTRNKKRFGFIG